MTKNSSPHPELPSPDGATKNKIPAIHSNQLFGKPQPLNQHQELIRPHCQICLRPTVQLVEVTLPATSDRRGYTTACCKECKTSIRNHRLGTHTDLGLGDLLVIMLEESRGYCIPREVFEGIIDCRLLDVILKHCNPQKANLCNEAR